MSANRDIGVRLSIENDDKTKAAFKAVGEEGEKAAEKLERASARPSQAFQRLASWVDPAYAAEQKYERGVVTLSRELDRGTISLEMHGQMMAKLQSTMITASSGTNRYGILIQQAGYQIADVAAVAAAGGNAMASVGTQLGQFLGFMGPIGSVAGAAVTILGLVATKMMDIGSGAEEAKRQSENYQKNLDSLVSLEKEYNDVLRERLGLDKLNPNVEQLKQNLREKEQAVGLAQERGDSFGSGLWSRFRQSIGLSRPKNSYEQAQAEESDARSQLSAALDYDEAIEKENALIEAQKEEADARQKSIELAQKEQEARDKARQAFDDHLQYLDNQRQMLTMTARDQFIFNEALKEEKNALLLGTGAGQEYLEKIKERSGVLFDQKQAIEDEKKAIQEEVKAREKALRDLEQGIDHATDKITDAFVNALDGSKTFAESFRDFMLSLFKEIAANAIIRPIIRPVVSDVMGGSSGELGGGILSGISGLFSSVFGGFRASGGPVSAGRAYVVGERAPELFVPSTSGTIVPQGSSYITMSPNISVSVSGSTGNADADATYAARIGKEVSRSIEGLVNEAVRKQMRPGGQIYNAYA